MLRVFLLAGVLAVALLAVDPFGASGRDRPRQIGPAVVVAQGAGWTLRAWKTADGLCITSYRPALAERAFCIPAAPLNRGGVFFACLCRQRSGRTLVLAAVKPAVRQAKSYDRRGTASLELYEPPPALDTELRFLRVHSGSPPRWRVEVYNRLGRRVGLAGQRFR